MRVKEIHCLSVPAIEGYLRRNIEVGCAPGSWPAAWFWFRGAEEAAAEIMDRVVSSDFVDRTVAEEARLPQSTGGLHYIEKVVSNRIYQILREKLVPEAVFTVPFRPPELWILNGDRIARCLADTLIHLRRTATAPERKRFDELRNALARAPRLPAIGTLWRHRKSGAFYRVTGAILDEKTVSLHVVYESESDPLPYGWGRPLNEFLERFDPVTVEKAEAAS